ncbi:PREDICTED: selenocysteine-specific elongation factor-like [Branchiostoma belcheri]|uniref:Selenocysteine-specific elongation factor n=1 Tax=Branchiostoma belcheri TaxID=7741 RepID=A0A6P4YYA0_BRABE|nr:PREDICTED: selenocysteine-specific elongation factor-like [Branchiostoma belcheri]
MAAVLNFNVGVLGHIDSGKTSLCKALSTVASTAAFDKHPQSKERGITLDLGFSSFSVDVPGHIKEADPKYEKLQFTLVDCPGHASLIKTIIGGAQIIDLMLLIVDVTKGMQTQTAECLVIGEIACQKMLVVLNKVDLLPEAKRDQMVDKMKRKMAATLKSTRFADAPIIAVAAKPGGPEAPDTEAVGLQELMDLLKKHTYLPSRDASGPFIFAVDHCFSIRGQGTVMTGTVLSGTVAINDNVEVANVKEVKKVKSMQMFKQPVNSAMQGDRVGVCVTQFDPKLLERGLVCTPGTLAVIHAAVLKVRKIRFFKGACQTKAKFHITMGHETVMARVQFFGSPSQDGVEESSEDPHFDFTREYMYQDELYGQEGAGKGKENGTADTEAAQTVPSQQWALLEFEKPVICPQRCLVIGSRLDTDIHANTCRLAFHGQLLEPLVDKNYGETVLPKLKVFKNKSKEGMVERMTDEYTVIGRSLFKKETNIQLFVGLKVKLSTGEEGVIEGGFGQSGKFKIRIPQGLQPGTVQQLSAAGKKKKGKKADEEEAAAAQVPEKGQGGIQVSLQFKKYIFDTKKKMIQT